jgi:hypothetical protein
MRMADLTPGWGMAGNDEQRVGQVRDVGQNNVLVSRSGLRRDV